MGRRTSSPLALAVLACLAQRPMHPYEMRATMRAQHKDTAVRLTIGSLYSAVNALHRDGFIEPVGTSREGNRPERTTYAITTAGAAELVDRVTHLLREPSTEYPRFGLGLDYLTALPPAEAVAALRTRETALTAEVAQQRADTAAAAERLAQHGLGRVYLLEDEFRLAMIEAELQWVRSVLHEFDAGALHDDQWEAQHET